MATATPENKDSFATSGNADDKQSKAFVNNNEKGGIKTMPFILGKLFDNCWNPRLFIYFSYG